MDAKDTLNRGVLGIACCVTQVAGIGVIRAVISLAEKHGCEQRVNIFPLRVAQVSPSGLLFCSAGSKCIEGPCGLVACAQGASQSAAGAALPPATG